MRRRLYDCDSLFVLLLLLLLGRPRLKRERKGVVSPLHEAAASGASAELELTPPEVVSSNEGGRVSAICINQQAVPVRAGPRLKRA